MAGLARKGLIVALAIATPPAMAAGVAAPQAEKVDPLLSPDARTRRSAIDAFLARPEAADPFAYAMLTSALWGEGRRLQAAFWFYVFQVRTRPWADADKQGDGAAALRASLNDGLGQEINGWLGSDLDAWREVATRAMSYEARLPLPSARPDGVEAGRWPAMVDKVRREYRQGYEKTLGAMTAEDLAAGRRENGLPVGPLKDAGPPLPADWR